MVLGVLDVPMVWRPKDTGGPNVQQPRLTLDGLRSVKVATPSTAGTVTVPDILAPGGPVAMATVTCRVEPVTVFPCVSRIDTSTGGIVWLETEVLGCFRKA